jgi:hypothetical protein
MFKIIKNKYFVLLFSLVIILICPIFLSLDKPISGNFIIYNLFAKSFSFDNQMFLLLDEFKFYPTFHTTGFLHLLAFFYKLFGYGVIQSKIFNLIILIPFVFTLLVYFFKENKIQNIIAILLWISLPITIQSFQLIDPSTSLNYVLIFLLYFSIKHLKKSFSYFVVITLLVVSIFWIKETTGFIVSLALFLSSLFYREKIFSTINIILCSYILFVATYLIYCHFYNLPADLIIKGFIYHSEMSGFIKPDIIFLFLLTIKGFVLWIGIPNIVLILIGVFSYLKYNKSQPSDIFIMIGFTLALGMNFMKGLFVPRYVFEYLLPVILISSDGIFKLYTENKDKFAIEKVNFKSSIIWFALIFIFVFVCYNIGDIVLLISSKNNASLIVKVFGVLFSTIISFILFCFFIYKKRISSIIYLLTFIILSNQSLNLVHAKSDYQTYTQIHGLKGFKETIEYLKNNVEKKNIVYTDHIDISFYIDAKIKHLVSFNEDIPGIQSKKNTNFEIRNLNNKIFKISRGIFNDKLFIVPKGYFLLSSYKIGDFTIEEYINKS